MKKRLIITVICIFLIIISLFNGLKNEITFTPKTFQFFYDQKVPFYDVDKIVEDDEGNIYIGQDFNTCVQKFDKNGNYIFTIGTRGKSVHDFYIEKNLIHIYINLVTETKERILDMDKKELVKEYTLKDDEEFNVPIQYPKKEYTIYNDNTINVKSMNSEYSIKFKDMPNRRSSSILYSVIGFSSFIIIIMVNCKNFIFSKLKK